MVKISSKKKTKNPHLVQHWIQKVQHLTSKKELERLPFELNIEDTPLTREQQAHLINMIYDHTEVISLFDRDLGWKMEKPVYLPHRQIPVQLQSEVRKCLDNWLKQGIICPSKSPYALQVVIVRKKTSEIRLCISFHKLNATQSNPMLMKPFQPFRSLFGF